MHSLLVAAGIPTHWTSCAGLDPRIHEAMQRLRPYGYDPLRFIMGCRVKPGNDVERLVRI